MVGVISALQTAQPSEMLINTLLRLGLTARP